jgi:hypothetical protein
MKPRFRHPIPGPTPTTVETARRLSAQAQRCAAGDHVYTWTGQIVDVPGGSPHLVMACAYGAVHEVGTTSPRLIGPPLTPQNIAKRLWAEEELRKDARTSSQPAPPHTTAVE